MSTEPPASTPPPGWYPDPAGTNRRRWWDGRAWTEYYGDSTWDGTVEQPPLPPGARVNTVFIWILTLLPLVSVVALLSWDIPGYFRRVLEDPQNPLVAYSDPGLLLLQGTGFLLYAAQVVLAYFDWRALKRIGVVKPFHWAWSFLSIVYYIGRPVVLWRRVHGGLAPLWTWIAVYLLSIVAVVVKIVLAVGALAQMAQNLAG